MKNLCIGETARGRKLHAVALPARDESWTKALCGAEVIVYANVSFDPENAIEATGMCGSCKSLSALSAVESAWAKYEKANAAWRAQWEKFSQAAAAGVTGAPLVQIDRKLTRLQDEMDDARDAWDAERKATA